MQVTITSELAVISVQVKKQHRQVFLNIYYCIVIYILKLLFIADYMSTWVMTFFNTMFLCHKSTNFCSKLMKSSLIFDHKKSPQHEKLILPYMHRGCMHRYTD